MGSDECITEGITVNCQVWYSVGHMGSEECITAGITVNCQVWYSVGPMCSEECITEGITVNCQVWYSMGPMGSEEWITKGITVNCQVWYSVGPMGSEECITEGLTVNCQVWYSVGPMGSEECFTEGMRSNLCWHSMSHMGSVLCQWRFLSVLIGSVERNKRIASRKAAECWYGQSPGWWKRSTVREQSLLAQNESYGLSAVPMEIAAGPDRREVLWVSNTCWHSMSDMASAMMGSCWKHQDSREGKHSFHLLNQFSYCKFWWWLILFGSINLSGRGFRGAQRRSCLPEVHCTPLIPIYCPRGMLSVVGSIIRIVISVKSTFLTAGFLLLLADTENVTTHICLPDFNWTTKLTGVQSHSICTRSGSVSLENMIEDLDT